jgi:hypothetical protein
MNKGTPYRGKINKQKGVGIEGGPYISVIWQNLIKDAIWLQILGNYFDKRHHTQWGVGKLRSDDDVARLQFVSSLVADLAYQSKVS